MFDTNKDGFIDLNELKKVIFLLHYVLPDLTIYLNLAFTIHFTFL